MAYKDEVLADSPDCYFRLAETDAAPAPVDTQGNYTASYVGSGFTKRVASSTGHGIQFDGNGHIEIANSTTLGVSIVNSKTGTVEFWLKITNPGANNSYHSLVGTNYGGTGRGYGLIMLDKSGHSDKLAASYQSSTATMGSKDFTPVGADGNWHHVCLVFDGTQLRLYVDGSQVTSVATSSTEAGNLASNIAIGHLTLRTIDDRLKGSMSEVAIYPTGLSSTRVAAHAAAVQTTNTATINPATYNTGSLLYDAAGALLSGTYDLAVFAEGAGVINASFSVSDVTVTSGVIANVASPLADAAAVWCVMTDPLESNPAAAASDGVFVFPATLDHI